MSIKNLSAYLTPDLELPWKGRTFVVPPPSKETGLKLAAINAMGVANFSGQVCSECGQTRPEGISAQYKALIDQMVAADETLEALALGPALAEMLDAGVPGGDIDLFALYSMYFWTLGEENADRIIESAAEARSGKAPAPLSRSKSGRSTGSGSRTSTASTRSTKSRTTSSPAE